MSVSSWLAPSSRSLPGVGVRRQVGNIGSVALVPTIVLNNSVARKSSKYVRGLLWMQGFRRTDPEVIASSGPIIDRGLDMDMAESRSDQWDPALAERLRQVARASMDEPEYTLFFTEHTKSLAQKIKATSNHITLGTVRWKTFEDGFPNLFIEDAHNLRNRHVAFLASFHSPQVMFEQLSVIYALPRMFVASFTLVLPFFPTGTTERVEDEGEVATAASMARVLSAIPLSRGGPTSLVIYDIHALQERFYFGDAVLPYFQSAIPLLKQRLARLPDHANVSIAYPDEGAWKRFHNQFEGFDELVCTKVRDGSKRNVRLKEGVANGRHVVIVDDLVQSGGTLIECHKVLTEAGAAHVSAFVTHGVFPNQSYKRFEPETDGDSKSGFANFWITDSCPQTVPAVENRAPFEVLSLAESVGACLHL